MPYQGRRDSCTAFQHLHYVIGFFVSELFVHFPFVDTVIKKLIKRALPSSCPDVRVLLVGSLQQLKKKKKPPFFQHQSSWSEVGLSAAVGACPLGEARAHVARSHSCWCVPHGEGGPWNILACVALIAGCRPCCKDCATRCMSAGHGRETRIG